MPTYLVQDPESEQPSPQSAEPMATNDPDACYSHTVRGSAVFRLLQNVCHRSKFFVFLLSVLSHYGESFTDINQVCKL